MDLKGVTNCWDNLARRNPVGAMLPADLSGRIADMEQFFASGQREIDGVMKYIGSLGIDIRRRKALDFGCGLGRMTQALANYFDEVLGVDIAPAILEMANKNNRHPAKCKYLLNQTNNLKVFENNTFDFIWCYGVLHLVEPRFFKDYINEFFRVLAPGGLAVFHQSAEPAKTLKGLLLRSTPARLLNVYRRAKYGFEVHSMRRADVIELVKSAGGTVLDIREDRRTPGPTWVGFQYCAVKTR
jgi:SAM-dependent methyltransferase